MTGTLQWGHGREAVEVATTISGTSASFWLQWGHGREAVEVGLRAAIDSRGHQLQWGHGREAVEVSARSRSGRRTSRFNGATAVRPWRSLAAADAGGLGVLASMGPRP